MMKCLKVEDALSYLDQVKARFSGQGAIYMDFLDVMRDFKAQTIGTEVVIRRVRELFEGHPDLITGFNTFIPQGYRMDAAISTANQSVNLRPVITNSTVRTTLAVSAVDNLSFIKPVCTTVKSTDVNNEWPFASCISVTVSSHENHARPTYASMIFNNNLSLSSSPQPMKAQPPVLNTDLPSYNLNQQFMPTDYQENYPNVLIKNCHSGSFSSNNQCQNQPHVYQQQHQIQSFHHALYYVNKIKGIPDVYKRFLDILQWYQKEQRHSDSMRRKQAELQVYQDMAKLFDGQEDLLQEFSQFLPESFDVANVVSESISGRKLNNIHFGGSDLSDVPPSVAQTVIRSQEGTISGSINRTRQNQDSSYTNQTLHPSLNESKKLKRLTSNNSVSGISSKKTRSSIRDVSVVDSNQFTTGLGIRDALDADNPLGSRSYQTFLQNVRLFHRCIISADELLDTTYTLFARHRDVWKSFSDLILSTSRHSHNMDFIQFQSNQTNMHNCERNLKGREKQSNVISSHSNMLGDSSSVDHLPASLDSLVAEIPHKRLDLDFTKLRTCGISYRALPSNFPQSKCSGRQKCPIAKEVLNDTYISFSSLTSEDSQFVSSKKNQYEENMYHVEDERYEVDMVIELNRAAMQNLVVIKRQMDRMSRDELGQYRLDDKLGGTSAILMRKAIHRVYGDKASDVIYGLKSCPSTVIPLVIQRMRQKDTEWRETIRNYQRSWADQDVKNYLRSLDHQGATFKQRDIPFIRSKTMISQIDAIARNDKNHFYYHHHPSFDPVGQMLSASLTHHNTVPRDLNDPGTIGSALANVLEGIDDGEGPHLTLLYPPSDVRQALMEDAASLIIHHVKRQSNASKDDKRAMKCLIRTSLQDIFMANRFPMSDDEDDDDDDDDEDKDNDVVSKVDDEEMVVDENEGGDIGQCRGHSNFRYFKNRRVFDLRKTPTAYFGADEPESNPKVKTDDSGNLVDDRFCNAGDELLTSGVGNASFIKDSKSMSDAYLTNFPKQEAYSVLFGNNHWYAFIRLHHLLLCRLHQLRSWSTTSAATSGFEKSECIQASEVLRLRRFGGIEPSQYYSRALNLIKDLLDGGEDITTYEDRLRDMFGIYAFPWFTMDKLIINIVRQLQALSSGDELSRRFTMLHRSWSCGSGASDRGSSNRPSIIHPGFSDIHGPLHNRFCRLANEKAYCFQALNLCSSYTSGSSNTNAQANLSANTGSGLVSGGFGNSVGGPNGLPNTGNGNGSNQPNCYLMVIMSEASSMFIRMMHPASLNKCDKTKTHSVCHSHTCNSHIPMNIDDDDDDEEGNKHIGLNIADDAIVSSTASSFNTSQKLTLHRKNFKVVAPILHWSDYLPVHLSWTLGHVPQNICSRIRPVFLYRTVRRCISSLTREALLRRQQDLVDTGDTQPEELMSTSVSSTKRLQLDCDHIENNPDVDTDDKSNTSCSSDHDIWEFMCRVFKNKLTKKELFRDTFSSDCMQSIQRMDAVRPTRNNKMNWSVGSYGIFFRSRKRPLNFKRYCPEKWHKFHSHWLSEHIINENCFLELSGKHSSSEKTKELSPTRCNSELYLQQSIDGNPLDKPPMADDILPKMPDFEVKDEVKSNVEDDNKDGSNITSTSDSPKSAEPDADSCAETANCVNTEDVSYTLN